MRVVALLLWLTSVGGARTATHVPSRDEPGRRAFGEMAQVLRHPRCLNCHPNDNLPRQGDDRHVHANLVRRGPEGNGVPGLRCSTCHQAENNTASGVPGKPRWHLAPRSMGWEGLTDAELCRAVKDPQRNGGRDLQALTDHLARDPLVAHGWDPGGERTPVPMPRERLVRLSEAWARAGAPCPR